MSHNNSFFRMNDPNRSKYIQKIRKLLALTDSPYIEEALSAATKARELMFRHKISEGEVIEKDVSQIGIRSIPFRNKWELELFKIIANHCRCEMYFIKQKFVKDEITFQGNVRCIGFEEDMDVTIELYKFLRNSAIMSGIEAAKDIHYHEKDGFSITSYYIGFVAGVKKAFDEQDIAHQEWALVVVIPDEVKKVYNEKTASCKKLSTSYLKPLSQGDIQLARIGQDTGYHLTKNRDLKELR